MNEKHEAENWRRLVEWVEKTEHQAGEIFRPELRVRLVGLTDEQNLAALERASDQFIGLSMLYLVRMMRDADEEEARQIESTNRTVTAGTDNNGR